MKSRPNFVFILADDLGYADLGIDRMATEGMLLTAAYANSSVCSPSRLAIATGRYQHRLHGGFDEPITSPNKGLPPGHPSMASLLRDAGYATALVGKWHMGSLPNFSPLKSGYEEFFGHLGGVADYCTHGLGGRHDLWKGDQEVHEKGYLTDLFTDRAVQFVRRQGRERPFLLSLHYNAPHWPWETREDEAEANRISNIAHLDGGSVKTYATMIHHMDEGIGKVLEAIDRIGARENTEDATYTLVYREDTMARSSG